MDATTNRETSTDLHPWVVLTQACLERTKPGDDGLVRPDKIKRLNVCVGKDSIQRSMLIWDRILKTAEQGRFKARMEKEPPCRTIVTVDGEELSIGLKEKTHRREHVPTPAEKLEMKRYTHIHSVPAWDYFPSGRLVLSIKHMNTNELTWSDNDKKRIEARLNSFAEVLAEVAKEIKERRAKAQEWERNWAEEQRRRYENAQREAEERKRREELERQASSWRLAGSIRQFVQAVREEAVRRTDGFLPGSPLDQWIQWAERHATSIDPVGTVLRSASSAPDG
jgi:hypothetical protein